MADGSWSQTETRCVAVTCPIPANIDNVVLPSDESGVSYSFREKMSVSCQEGYALIGPSELTCGASRSWEEALPRCVLLACGPPTHVLNAHIEGNNFRQGEAIHYICNPGYRLIGSGELVCGESNMWEGSLPMCALLDCGTLPDFTEAIATLVSGQSTYGSLATLTCNSGFYHVGDPNMKCGDNGSWEFDEEFECKPVDCGEPPVIQYGTVDVGDTTLGGAALYTCDKGYYMATSSSMFCEESGEWAYELPQCRAVDCLSPPVLPDATSTTGQGTEYKAMAIYQCNPGYGLVDVSVNSYTCGSMGVWEANIPPSCQPLDCGDPPKIAHAKVILDNGRTNYLSDALYRCDAGYHYTAEVSENSQSDSPTNSLSCGESGEWVGGPISCTPVDCGAYPEIPLVTYNSKNGTKFSASASYSCPLGFYKQGPELIVCEANGRWSSYTHACVPIDCGSPPETDHGSVTFLATTFQSDATYTCTAGYRLTGDQNSVTSRCEASGSWSHSPPPVCLALDCLVPPTIRYGASSYNATVLHSTAIYSCIYGYTLSEQADSTVKCGESGLWEREVGGSANPTCLPVNCSHPMSPAHGHVSFSAVTFGSRAVYSCLPGYSLERSEALSSKCEGNGTWIPETPACVPVDCSQPPEVGDNTMFAVTGTIFGSTASYSCDLGFRLVSQTDNSFIDKGDNKNDVRVDDNSETYVLQCKEDAKWNGSSPVCEVITCDDPIPIDNGVFEHDSNLFDSVAVLKCDEGFTLSGEGKSVCSESGYWYGAEASSCEPIHCPVPPEIPNGSVEFTSLSYDSKASYVCDPGYALSGTRQFDCRKSGWFGGQLPSCTLIICPTPLEILNGGNNHSSGQLLSVGQAIKYTCDPGYELKGADVVSCGHDGLWSPAAPACLQLLCPGPPLPANSVITSDTGRRVKSQVSYTCVEGYKLQASQADSMPESYPEILTITCDIEGKWSGSIPSCQLVRCQGSPPSISHATVITTGTIYASEAIYTCARGYKAIGEQVLTCDRRGRWSPSDATKIPTGPVCEPVSCGAPPTFPTSTFTGGDDFTVNSTVIYSCQPGYDLDGDESSRCLFTGQWSPVDFDCKVRACSAPISLENGEVGMILAGDDDFPVVGDIAEVVCHDGFVLVGTAKLRCMESGVWNTTWPRCEPINESCTERVDVPNSQAMPAGHRPGDQTHVHCIRGYESNGVMLTTCLPDRTWTVPTGYCKRISCGKPTPKAGSENTVSVVGWTFRFEDTVFYMCRYGFLAAHNPPVLTCGYLGQWDDQPECIAQCKQGCLNGGRCVGNNQCKCPPGWAGPRCEHANCVMPCLHGGRCVGPYNCVCRNGYAGTRCQKAVCSKPCKNGGRCMLPNRCQCRHGFYGAYCEKTRKVGTWRYNFQY